MKTARRLEHIKPYYFSGKMSQIRQMMDNGLPVINLGIGSPDLAPDSKVIKAIQLAAELPDKHGYQPYKGLPEFRQAVANFYKQYYQVQIDPATEVMPLFGSKEGIMHISMAFLNKGDQVLVPNPGYMTYPAVSQLLEAETIAYNLTADQGWYPDFDALEKQDLSRVKIMWVNYPHMPTGAKATTELYKQLVDFGLKHKILIVNDNPYSFVLTEKPLSILSIAGAKETAIELNSLSKTFNMAGWRIGVLLGKQSIIDEVFKVKSNMDSGMYYGLQMGAVQALDLGQDWFDKLDAVYQKRREIIWQIADALDLVYQKDAEGLFVWAKLPNGQNAYEVSDAILEQQNVFITPGDIFGSQGQGYLRFSLCVNVKKLEEVQQRLSKVKI